MFTVTGVYRQGDVDVHCRPHCLPHLSKCRVEFFSKCTVTRAKMSHLMGIYYYLFARLYIVSLHTEFNRSSLSHFWDRDKPPKLKMGHRRNHAPSQGWFDVRSSFNRVHTASYSTLIETVIQVRAYQQTPTKFEVPTFTYYGDMKGDVKCSNYCGLGS